MILAGIPVVIPPKVAERIAAAGIVWEPSPEHVKSTCTLCNAECWIGPKQAAVQREDGNVIWCVECIARSRKDKPVAIVIPLATNN